MFFGWPGAGLSRLHECGLSEAAARELGDRRGVSASDKTHRKLRGRSCATDAEFQLGIRLITKEAICMPGLPAADRRAGYSALWNRLGSFSDAAGVQQQIDYYNGTRLAFGPVRPG
jgi:hypothetical protein